ncbi:MAG: heme lyase CcmF/NrfE family subunit [Acidimicrobiales bacterium]|nr:heme lyase CcmF/NrfE family subunit [Acidimicrobiales bacterium]
MSALLAALVTGIGLATNRRDLISMSGKWSIWTLLSASGAVAVMEYSLLTNDFSMAYVADNSTLALPLLYKIAAMWASLEGSLILWVFVLCLYISAVAWWFSKRLDDRLLGFAMLTLFIVAAFFFFLLAGPASPFDTLSNPPLDGRGPNPLLQNHPLMAIHPIMLYLGYVGFTVPFAFAIGALATGRLGEGWLIETRVWTVAAWGFLSLGIVLGAWWSYEVLGWGGYWAWDPVENVSFVPWLTATAFIHSVVVQERRGMLRVWNLSLIVSTFALTILGTFVTRSGVLDSVHEFSESEIGPLLLGLFAATVLVSVALIFWRIDILRSAGAIESPLSREGSFLGNNLLFGAFAFVVLLGTLFPLLVEALNDDQISVGSPYFDRLTAPIGLVLLFLMAISPMLPWRSTDPELLSERAFWPAVAGVATLIIAVAAGADSVAEMFAYLFSGMVLGSAGRQLITAVRRRGIAGLTGRSSGGMVAHIGLAVLALGFVASQAHSHEVEARLTPGESTEVAGHQIELLGRVDRVENGNPVTEVSVRVNNNEVHHPALTNYINYGMKVGTPSVDTGWRDDVYLVVLDVSDSGDSALIRVIVRPLITWIWTGGMLMALGTALALTPAGRRSKPEPIAQPISSAPPDDDRTPETVGAST